MDLSSDFFRVLYEDDKELTIRVGGFNGLFDAIVQLFILCLYIYLLIIRQNGVIAILIGFIVLFLGYTILSMQFGRYIIQYSKVNGFVNVTRKSYFGLLSIRTTSSESPVQEWRVERVQNWRGRRGFEPYTLLAITEAGEVIRCSSQGQFLEISLQDILVLLRQEVNKTRSRRSVRGVNP